MTMTKPLGTQIDFSSGDLSIDTNTLHVDSTNNRVGIGTASPSSVLHIKDNIPKVIIEDANNTTAGNSYTPYIEFNAYGDNVGSVGFTQNGNYLDIKAENYNSAPIRLFTGGSERLRIDSSGNIKLITANDTAGTSKFLTFGTNSFNRAGIKCTNAATYDGSLEFYTGNSSNFNERMRIDSNGNVGIGTTSPSSYHSSMNNLVIAGSTDSGITIASGTASEGSIVFADGTSGADAYRGWISYNHNSNFMRFFTDGAERMRIDSGGNVGIGANSGSTIKFRSYQTATSSYSGYFTGNNYNLYSGLSSTAGYQVVFSTTNTGTTAGTIYSSGSTTSYNTSSDYRLKENVQPLTGGIDRLKQLKPSHWTWVQNGEYGEGFVAHETQQVVPLSVTGTKDAMRIEEYEVTPAVFNDAGVETAAAVMGTREVPDYQGIDQSKLVPLLTAALQEAVAKIESLEQRIATLEAN